MRGNDPEKEFRDRDAFQAYERRWVTAVFADLKKVMKCPGF